MSDDDVTWWMMMGGCDEVMARAPRLVDGA
jgi:hypothetical protein